MDVVARRLLEVSGSVHPGVFARAEAAESGESAAHETIGELKAELDASYATMAARAEQIARAKEAELREGHEAEEPGAAGLGPEAQGARAAAS